MGVPISDVGYTSATTGRGDHEVHNGHVVALGVKRPINNTLFNILVPYIITIIKV
jgi:hypothetical protein